MHDIFWAGIEKYYMDRNLLRQQHTVLRDKCVLYTAVKGKGNLTTSLRSSVELETLRKLYEEMERIVGATTMTFEILTLPKKLVYVVGNLVSELFYHQCALNGFQLADLISVDTPLPERP